MHRGFKLQLGQMNDDNYEQGYAQFEATKKYIEITLKDFVGKDGVLNGSQLQNEWFPQVEADIFISHSHGDKDMAISLAGWIKRVFNLNVFIDSCVWGYADDLLRLVDNKYCLNPGGETYNYERRNESTSHIHMMLSTALSMMIDKTECLFFLNTPNSIQTYEAISKTKSPWIYSEIVISQIIRKKKLSDYRPERTKAFALRGRIDESVMVNYDVDLAHLQDLKLTDLDKWRISWENVSLHEKYPLNYLYELFPVDKYI